MKLLSEVDDEVKRWCRAQFAERVCGLHVIMAAVDSPWEPPARRTRLEERMAFGWEPDSLRQSCEVMRQPAAHLDIQRV